MAVLPSSTNKSRLTLSSPSLFLESYGSFSALFPQNSSPPPVVGILSSGSPTPPVPPGFPQHKLIPSTRFVVDGFRASGDFSVSYFLSHFHSDHYAGLGPAWCSGVIYCSDITARLLIEVLGVSPSFVVALPLGESVQIDGCDVTAIEANHCPGAVQFLFVVHRDEKRRCEKYVHTGDFRYSESMKSDPVLREFVGADAVFLDTTYCYPKFSLPSQNDSIEYIVNTIEKNLDRRERSEDSVLFLIATYIVGKEKILLEVARRLNCVLHVDDRKMGILRVLGLAESEVFTEDASSSHVHVIGWNLLGETWPYFRPNFVKMKEIMAERGYSRAVGFVPSGWMYEKKRLGFPVRVKESLEIHLVPYSEHSSYEELRAYVRFLRPKRVVPTVGNDVSTLDSKQTFAMQKHFAGLVDETANKKDFLMGFLQGQKDDNGGDDNDLVIDANGTIKENDTYLWDWNASSNKERERAIKELRECLPSWVTEDQILYLLNCSNGDIVEAVSEFYEHETELHKQVNSTFPPTSSTQTCSPNLVTLHPGVNSTQEHSDYSTRTPVGQIKKTTGRDQNKKATGRELVSVKTISSSKRVATTSNRSKKKGKSFSELESTASKQSIITNFFGKLASISSQSGELCSTTAEEHPADGKVLQVDTENVLDQFLQITNGSLTRNAAAILLEKMRGDVNAALDLYYTSYDSVSGNEGMPLRTVVNKKDAISVFHTGKENNSSSGRTNLPTLSVEEASTVEAVSTFVFLPLEKYSPIEHACWKAGQPAPYIHLACTFDLVEKEKGKIKTTSMLCNMFRSLLALSPEDVLAAVYLCTNKIAPEHANMELNIGGGLVTAALEQACGVKRSKIRDMYNSLGDLGDVAQSCQQTQSLLAIPRPLLIQDLFSVLRKISVETGSGSVTRKKDLVVNIMCSCREMEMKFLVRTLVRNLRIGAMLKTILPALAQAVVLNSSFSMSDEKATEGLKVQLQGISTAVVEAYNILPNLDLLVPALLNKGVDFSCTAFEMVPGSPIPPMLARVANGIPQVLKLFQDKAFICEYKYDGQRAQIHKLVDGSIHVFSRKMGETTSKFPDLVNLVQELCKPVVSTFILDAEVVAIDRAKGNRLMAFQQLSSRERGSRDSTISLESIKVDICSFVFDIMYYNGKQLLSLPLRERRKYLEELFYGEKPGYLEFAKEMMVEAHEATFSDKNTLAKMNSFLEDACKSSCEGIVVKSLDVDAGYAASKRSDAWLKVKRDYVDELGDSLDLVPIGAWYGNGRKAGWYSPFLMACYNTNTEEFQSVCRVMSGFSDPFYMEMKGFFSGDKILSRKPPYYQTDEAPDLWFSPGLVWEILCADMTVSPVHHAAIGLVHPTRGISMRFPRFVRSLPDRRPEDCSTAVDIANMFKSQTRRMDVKLEE